MNTPTEREQSSAPVADTSAAGEWTAQIDSRSREYVVCNDNDGSEVLRVSLDTPESIVDAFIDAANASLAALREQLEQAQKDRFALLTMLDVTGVDAFRAELRRIISQRNEAQAALKQKDEALREAREHLHDLGSINTTVTEALAIHPDSSALNAVIEAETAKLREGVERFVAELADPIKWNWCYGVPNRRYAADEALRSLCRAGVIEHEAHPYGGDIWKVGDKLFGRTDALAASAQKAGQP